MMDYNTIVIVNDFGMRYFVLYMGFIYLSNFRIPILVILGCRNDVLRNIRFDSNKRCLKRMFSLQNKIYS